jgi:hypothetical protein
MYTKRLYFLLLMMILLLNACSPLALVRSSGGQPTPVASTDPVPPGYQPIAVDDVQVDVGVGSPIPVFVRINGNLPDQCSQVEYTEIRQDGTDFIIKLAATPYAEGCVRDTLPFRLSIPLSVVGLPGGSYAATVNGRRAEFKLDTAASNASLQTADMSINKSDIKVDSVSVEHGTGSPILVHAIVSANLPSTCAQLGEVRFHRAEKIFFVQLLAYIPAQAACNSDTLPFRLEVPLNIVNLPEGTYEVNVNGTTTTFELPFPSP